MCGNNLQQNCFFFERGIWEGGGVGAALFGAPRADCKRRKHKKQQPCVLLKNKRVPKTNILFLQTMNTRDIHHAAQKTNNNNNVAHKKSYAMQRVNK